MQRACDVTRRQGHSVGTCFIPWQNYAEPSPLGQPALEGAGPRATSNPSVGLGGATLEKATGSSPGLPSSGCEGDRLISIHAQGGALAMSTSAYCSHYAPSDMRPHQADGCGGGDTAPRGAACAASQARKGAGSGRCVNPMVPLSAGSGARTTAPRPRAPGAPSSLRSQPCIRCSTRMASASVLSGASLRGSGQGRLRVPSWT